MQTYPNNQDGITTTTRALHGFTITSEDLSGVVNALACCVPVTRPASTKLTDSPQREQRCDVSITQSDYRVNLSGMAFCRRCTFSSTFRCGSESGAACHRSCGRFRHGLARLGAPSSKTCQLPGRVHSSRSLSRIAPGLLRITSSLTSFATLTDSVRAFSCATDCWACCISDFAFCSDFPRDFPPNHNPTAPKISAAIAPMIVLRVITYQPPEALLPSSYQLDESSFFSLTAISLLTELPATTTAR